MNKFARTLLIAAGFAGFIALVRLAESDRRVVSETADLPQIASNSAQDVSEPAYRYSSDWPVSAPTAYRELHKDVSTGTHVRYYAVEAWLHDTGRFICAQYLPTYPSGGYCSDADEMLPIENAFAGEDARRFYDMRGRLGCFLIDTDVGALKIISLVSGRCATADQRMDELRRRQE